MASFETKSTLPFPLEAITDWSEIRIIRGNPNNQPVTETKGSFGRTTKPKKYSKNAGRGRGWWGDPAGHARAGSRSHTNS